MGFPDGWGFYKTRNIKRASGALSNWQARLVIAEGSSDVIGSELVTNGDGESTTGWTTYQCSVASVDGGYSGKCFQVTDAAASGSNQIYRDITSLVTVGKRYRLSGYVKSGTSGDELYKFAVHDSVWGWQEYILGTSSSEWVYVSKDFILTQTAATIRISFLKNSYTDGTMLFDSISLVEIADITLGGHAKTDFGDLRFSNSANGPLDYFIDHVDGTTPNQAAHIDVEIDSVATSDTQIKVWYGNSSATSESSSANTFILFDDFERGNDGDAVGGDWTVSAGTCEIDTAQKYAGTRSFRAVGSVGGGGLATIPMTAASGEYAIQVWMRKQDAAWASLLAHGDGAKRLSLFANTSEDITTHDGSTYNDTGANSTNDTWQLYEVNNIDFSAGTFDVYQDNSLIKSGATMATSSANEDNIRIGCGSFAADVWIDNLIVRQWNATPPEWQGDGWSAEQSNSGGEVTGPAGIKSVNGILSAAIKSRNTTAWSAIKALNN